MQKSANKMDVFVHILYLLTDFLYEVIKNSFFFWLYLIKGFGIFTLYATINALLAVSSDVLENERKHTFNNFRRNYKNNDRRRFLSVFLFFFMLYLFIIPFLPAPTVIEETLWQALTYLALFIEGGTFLMLFTHGAFKQAFSNLEWSIPLQIYMLVKGMGWTFLLSVGLLLVFWFSLQNGIFLFGFAPGILGISSVWIVSKIKSRVTKDLGKASGHLETVRKL